MCQRCESMALALVSDALLGTPEHDVVHFGATHDTLDLALARGRVKRDLGTLLAAVSEMTLTIANARDAIESEAAFSACSARFATQLAGHDAQNLHRLCAWSGRIINALRLIQDATADGIVGRAKGGDAYARDILLRSVAAGALDAKTLDGVPGVDLRRVKKGPMPQIARELRLPKDVAEGTAEDDAPLFDGEDDDLGGGGA